MAAKGKHVSFPNQREQCRLNKYTYTEKCSCGIITLMCNYPFTEPGHKKGVCRASTCTDMRKTLAEDIGEISGLEAVPEFVAQEEEPGAELAKEADAQEASEAAHEEAESSLDATPDGAGQESVASDIAKTYVGAKTKPEEGDPKGAVRAE